MAAVSLLFKPMRATIPSPAHMKVSGVGGARMVPVAQIINKIIFGAEGAGRHLGGPGLTVPPFFPSQSFTWHLLQSDLWKTAYVLAGLS
jgi:hypothetical protein